MTINFYLETYGCSLNTADSDIIVGILTDLGGNRVDTIDAADIAILNTCGVKEPTEDRIISRLERLNKSTIPIIIAGCLPKISFDRVEQALPGYAAILGPQSIESMIDVIPRVLNGETGIIHLESQDTSKLKWLEGPPRSVICTIPICEGCLGNCAYCAVRFARGAVKSHPMREIIDTITRCIHSGYKEIRITSQDLGTYGVDIDSNLVNLITMIDKLDGTHRFRLGMFNPNLVLESITKLVEVMKSDHFFKFFHIPLQSGSDDVLREMHRKYTVAEWEHIVYSIRNEIKDATIATDIIVGFPGETDNDFEITLDLLSNVRPSVVNISKYGDRPGTEASSAQNKVDTAIKKERSRQLTKLVGELSEENNKSWIGWAGPCIVTEPGSRGGLVCRNPSYKPVIISDTVDLGAIVPVHIVDAERTHLLGEVIF